MSASNINATFVETLPISVLQAVPAALPPPGVEANFVNPPTLVPQILGVSYTFLVIAVLTFVLRIWTKARITEKWQWDDLTIFLGLLCALMYNGFVTAAAVDGPIGKHLWDVHLDVLLRKSDTLQNVATTILITPALGLIKSSFFIRYYVLFKTLRWIRIGVWIGAMVSVVFYAAVSISALALAVPHPGQTLFEDILSQRYQRMAAFSIPTGVVGMLVDWYLVLLPIPAVVGLALSNVKKLGILLMFMTGGVAAVASIVSLNYRVKLQVDPSDQTWKVSYIYIWAQVEMFAGVTASNMPAVKQFYIHHKPQLETAKARVARLLHLKRSSSSSASCPNDSQDDSLRRKIMNTDYKRNQYSTSDPTSDHTQYTTSSTTDDKKSYDQDSQIQVTREIDVRSVDLEMVGSMPRAAQYHTWLDLGEK